MSEYTAARNRTRAKIERAFWDLYLEKKFRRVTVREIVQRAGIHRSTFYIYFEAVEDIFSAIKERQLSLLQEVLATEGEGEGYILTVLSNDLAGRNDEAIAAIQQISSLTAQWYLQNHTA